MNTIKGFTAEEATVIVGQVLDDSMEDALRVTMVATGLGSPLHVMQTKPMHDHPHRHRRLAGHDGRPAMTLPNVIKSRRERTIHAMEQSGIETLDIPAFLRKQAD